MTPDRIVLYPTVGTLSPDGNFYILDVHGWIYDPTRQTKLGRAVISVLRKKLNLIDDASVSDLFQSRSGYFAVYPGKRKTVLLKIGTFHQVSSKANRLGQFKDTLKVPREIVEAVHGDSIPSTLEIEASLHSLDPMTTEETSSTIGHCHILSETGVSLVTDIDDTIKHTIVRNKQELLINTFLNPFQSVDGMAEVYRDLRGAVGSFHFVSASPWQIFSPLSEFIKGEQFPDGSIHLRKFGLKDVTFLKKLSPSYKQKRKIIDALLARFPKRQFILVGDSGEYDAEMYASLYHSHKTGVAHIFIRNVPGADNSARRFQKAFTGVPTHTWGTFDDADQLRSQLTSYLQATDHAPTPTQATLPFSSASG